VCISVYPFQRLANYRSALERFLDGNDEAQAVIEAGRSSYTMVDLLDELSIERKGYRTMLVYRYHER